MGVGLAIAGLVGGSIASRKRVKRQSEAGRARLEELVADRTKDLVQAMSSLEKSYDITLEVLGNAVDLKAGTAGHSRRVTAYTIVIARAMGLTKRQINIIARGAFLHDIAKLAISDTAHSTDGPLTLEEASAMREYPLRGYALLKKIPFLLEAADIVYAHEEHFDGGGYPRGLKGSEIPLGARIVALANLLDTITSGYSSSTPEAIQVAKREIESRTGHQFDPEIVGVFLTLPENIWADLRKEIDNRPEE